ncbi:MAG: kynureninase [Pseudomonadota bacterium]
MRKEQFHIPEGTIYLDGNSLGPLPVAASARVQQCVDEEWKNLLIAGWNEAGWYHQPRVLGNKLAPIIGAADNTVVVGDTLSIKVYQALAAALHLQPERRVILSDSGNFPTDLYMAEGLIKSINNHLELKIVEPEAVADHLDNTVAVMMLTHVDYRTGRMHDMAHLTHIAHAHGAVALWDLAHSAGALPVDLTGCNPEFAVGCTYKYLNAGPGAPAFIYVRPDIADTVQPALSGWMGHTAPFAFDPHYQPAPAIERMRIGTPPVLQMAALEAALEVWSDVSIKDIRQKSIELSELFIEEVEKRCPQLTLASPRDSTQRGSQVSFRFNEGYAVIRALIEQGVIGDFRAPDIMRFGFTPLYIDPPDVINAAIILEDIMRNNTWDNDRLKQRAAVT